MPDAIDAGQLQVVRFAYRVIAGRRVHGNWRFGGRRSQQSKILHHGMLNRAAKYVVRTDQVNNRQQKYQYQQVSRFHSSSTPLLLASLGVPEPYSTICIEKVS